MSKQNNAKYTFYYLLSLVALIFVSLSLGMIIFSIIDKSIIDSLINYPANVNSQLRFAISAIIISAPIFYFIVHLINIGLRRGELTKDFGLRRWLTYFILLVSSLIVLGVLIGIINTFLSGEITSRFILKALTVFLISSAVFSFYFYDIKRERVDQPDPIINNFFKVSLIIVIAIFIASWFFVESPQITRARRLDGKLANNIRNLDSAVNSYYQHYNKLPDSLEALESDPGIYLDPKTLIDPGSKQIIVYKKSSDRNFKLCATFRLASSAEAKEGSDIYLLGNYHHQAGYQCLNGRLFKFKP